MPEQPLRNRVDVVAGATRGAGRGIARMLGAAGATVYCTGRSVRERPATPGRPETIEETATLVTAEGGRGIAVRTDHTVESAVEQLFARVHAEAGRLDVLVNDIWGGDALTEWGRPFWELTIAGNSPSRTCFAVTMCCRFSISTVKAVPPLAPIRRGNTLRRMLVVTGPRSIGQETFACPAGASPATAAPAAPPTTTAARRINVSTILFFTGVVLVLWHPDLPRARDIARLHAHRRSSSNRKIDSRQYRRPEKQPESTSTQPPSCPNRRGHLTVRAVTDNVPPLHIARRSVRR